MSGRARGRYRYDRRDRRGVRRERKGRRASRERRRVGRGRRGDGINNDAEQQVLLPTLTIRVTRGSFIAVYLEEPFAGKQYGIARVTSRRGTYRLNRDLPMPNGSVLEAGTEVVDILWCNIINNIAIL